MLADRDVGIRFCAGDYVFKRVTSIMISDTCVVTVTRMINSAKYVVGFYKNGKRIRENVWHSRSMVRESITKSGAQPKRGQLKFPIYPGQTLYYPANSPNWFWNE